jgi:5-methylcytosine-specific restriction endonuclease McrA
MWDRNSERCSSPEGLRLALEEEQLAAAKATVADNKGALGTVLLAIGLRMSDDPELRDDLARLFMEQETIPTSVISNAVCLSGRELWQLAALDPISLFGCLDCGEPLPVRDRRELMYLSRAAKRLSGVRAGDLVDANLLSQLLCEGCTQTRLELHNEEARLQRLARQARVAQLRKMPFTEYRKTPEWQARRAAALARAGFRCQTCGTRDARLDVHHNSYARYGNESVFDLVVLCDRCHGLFHGPLSDAA